MLLIVYVWLLFCSIRVHTSLDFLPILLKYELFIFLRCVELNSMEFLYFYSISIQLLSVTVHIFLEKYIVS